MRPATARPPTAFASRSWGAEVSAQISSNEALAPTGSRNLRRRGAALPGATAMKVTVWGCRGSHAAPGAATVRCGGNTSCVQLEMGDGQTVVLDAGTGIRALGERLARRPSAPIHLFLSHLHLDHLEGLPFFAPLWAPGAEIHIWAPACPGLSPSEAITRYVSPPLFPLELSEAPARVSFHELPAGEWTLGSARVRAEPVVHPGPTVGYRFEDGGRSLAYIPDHEPYHDAEPGAVEPQSLSGYRLARDATLLLHDAQYLEHEYGSRRGWGHSSVSHAVAFALAARAQRLLLFHHDPLHSDIDLAQLEARARVLWTAADSPTLAREGMCVELADQAAEPAAQAA
jgi:phosphoribosyl 1,2-cyclic phosphodiesterase